MVGGASKSRRSALRYTAGGALCLLTVAAERAGLEWYWTVVMSCVTLLVILGGRRIFRAGVTRTSDAVVCRYIPWFEGNAYFLNAALPVMGVALVFAGHDPANPVWLRYGGFCLLAVTPLLVYSAASMWRRCVLCIRQSALTVRLAGPKDVPREIPRELLQSVTPKMIRNSVNGRPSLQIEIAYRTADSSLVETVLLGLQLTVEPTNLLNALVAWKDASDDDPGELLDRIETILRGHSMAGV